MVDAEGPGVWNVLEAGRGELRGLLGHEWLTKALSLLWSLQKSRAELPALDAFLVTLSACRFSFFAKPLASPPSPHCGRR